MKLVFDTMTFGESVFVPKVGAFINTFLDAGCYNFDSTCICKFDEGFKRVRYIL